MAESDGSWEAIEASENLHDEEDAAADFLVLPEVSLSEFNDTLQKHMQELQETINKLMLTEDANMDPKTESDEPAVHLYRKLGYTDNGIDRRGIRAPAAGSFGHETEA